MRNHRYEVIANNRLAQPPNEVCASFNFLDAFFGQTMLGKRWRFVLGNQASDGLDQRAALRRPGRAVRMTIAVPRSQDLLLCAKDLFVAAMDGKGPSHLTGRGKLSRAELSDQFGPSHSAFTGRAKHFLLTPIVNYSWRVFFGQGPGRAGYPSRDPKISRPKNPEGVASSRRAWRQRSRGRFVANQAASFSGSELGGAVRTRSTNTRVSVRALSR